jgi:hypothetical protein
MQCFQVGGVCADERFWPVISESNGIAMLVEILFSPVAPSNVRLEVCLGSRV